MTKSVRLMLDIETEMLENMISLISRGRDVGGMEWQLERLKSLGLLRELNARTIAKNRDKIVETIREEIEYNAFRRATQVDAAVKETGKVVAVSAKASPQVNAIIADWERVALEKVGKMYGDMLAKAGEVYQQTVLKTTAKVQLGMSGRKAIAQTATEWAEKGIPALVDRAGREWTTEAYAQAIVRTTSTNVANGSQLARMEELDQDLVEVSSHLGSRPEHADFQGEIYSISGRSNKYPPLSVTGYGTAGGIGGVNCRHVIYPYFEGTKKTYNPFPEKKNDAVYEKSQRQRALERSIRYAKREKSLAERIGDREAIDNANAKVRARQKAMREFIDDTGRKRQSAREQIYE